MYRSLVPGAFFLGGECPACGSVGCHDIIEREAVETVVFQARPGGDADRVLMECGCVGCGEVFKLTLPQLRKLHVGADSGYLDICAASETVALVD